MNMTASSVSIYLPFLILVGDRKLKLNSVEGLVPIYSVMRPPLALVPSRLRDHVVDRQTNMRDKILLHGAADVKDSLRRITVWPSYT